MAYIETLGGSGGGGSIPNGKTVTPTNSVQTLLQCAGITDKAYTTISQLLADATSLASVIANNNAADYLARSTTWASDVTADSGAMTLIGANDYCAETLLLVNAWDTAICNSTYFESVLNVKVPTMTSMNQPSGQIFVSGTYQGYSQIGAFDGNDNTYWASDSSVNPYVGYEFTSPVIIYKFYANPRNEGTDITAYIEASNDGNIWTRVSDGFTYGQHSGAITGITIKTDTKYRKYRLVGNGTTLNTTTLQFYGRIPSSHGGSSLSLEIECSSVMAGTTVTITDGITTLTKTCPSSSPYTINVELPNQGTWTISATVSGNTYTRTVDYPTTISLVPDGKTVTPTDDIQTWLNCAGIWDKAYTTIADVLADTTTLNSLIGNSNAVDYMARSTTWANSVTADSTAMTSIGANNYCSDSLLDNSIWRYAIAYSPYFTSVLNASVPAMTSNTTPSGEAFAYTASSTEFPAFRAFNRVANQFYAAKGNMPQYLGYEFADAIKGVRFRFNPLSYQSIITISFMVEGSNDGTNWISLYSDNKTITTSTTVKYNGENSVNADFVFDEYHEYKYYRYKQVSTTYSNNVNAGAMQIYGRVDV